VTRANPVSFSVLIEKWRCRNPRQKISSPGPIINISNIGHIPYILEQEGSKEEYRKNWARLIQKIYEIDLLTCPKCQGQMRIISFIEDEEVIKKILKHLGLWEIKTRPPPRPNALPKAPEYYIDYTDSQLPVSDKWLYVDAEYLSEP